MFIGRKHELNTLEKAYESDHFEFIIIYGRRRVGKSTLINESIRGKKAIYYMAIEANPKLNLEGLSKLVLQSQFQNNNLPSFQSYEDLFNFIDTICNQDIIIAIDEYPYLAKEDSSISSLIQRHIDTKWKYGKLKLILCGSSMSFMENQVLGYKSPLYGRRTTQIKLNPFTVFDMKELNWNYSDEDLCILYGITSGVAEYIQFIDPKLSIKENIIKLYFEPSGRMVEEPTNLIKQEMNNPSTYHSILNAITNGSSKLNEIATKIGESTSACTYYLNNLISLGIVGKETPLSEKGSSRKTIYSMIDTSFLFYYRYVMPNISLIMSHNGEYIFENFVEDYLSNYMGPVFEIICKDYLKQPSVISKLPIIYNDIGRWWGNNPILKRQEEIDIVALGKNKILLGECKWTTRPINQSVLNDLLIQGSLFALPDKYYYLFSKSGFDIKEKNEQVYLISLSDMFHS